MSAIGSTPAINSFSFAGGTRSAAEETALLLRMPVKELPANPANPGFKDIFESKLGVWSARMGAGEVFDHAFESMGKRGFDPVMLEKNVISNLKANNDAALQIAKTYAYGYEGLFSLRGASDVVLKDVKSIGNYKAILKYNFGPQLEFFKPVNLISNLKSGGKLFKFGIKDYIIKTLWGRNIEPLKPGNFLIADAKGLAKVSGAGLSQALGLGLFGWDIAKTTKVAYDNAQSDDASSNASVAAATGKEFGKQFTKSLITWEAAGAGLAIGRKALPGINIGKHHLPLGGMVAGALVATAVNKVLEKISPKAERQER